MMGLLPRGQFAGDFVLYSVYSDVQTEICNGPGPRLRPDLYTMTPTVVLTPHHDHEAESTSSLPPTHQHLLLTTNQISTYRDHFGILRAT